MRTKNQLAQVCVWIPLLTGLLFLSNRSVSWAQGACAQFPSGIIPFSSVYYVSSPNAAGDRLVVGVMSLQTLSQFPLPSVTNQRYCGSVQLAPGMFFEAYVPTSAERLGNFSAFAGLLRDPLTNQPFPGGIIPTSRLGNPHAWRILPTTGLSLTRVSPNSLAAGGPQFELTVYGSNFGIGSTVRWNGSSRITTINSSKQLRARIPATDIEAAGTANITVSSPSGVSSNAIPISISNPRPSINCLNPTLRVAGRPAFSLTVYGSQFVRASTVVWNERPRPTRFIDATELRADIPASDIASVGMASIAVSTPAPSGGFSNTLPFRIITISANAPRISSLIPDRIEVGSSVRTLTVIGAGFVPGSIVQFNGQNRRTVFASSTQLTADILSADVAMGCTISVTVVNPSLDSVSDVVHDDASDEAIVTVVNPLPLISSLGPPPTAVAGGAAFPLGINGINFVSNSTARWNADGRDTTFLSRMLVRGGINASDINTPGTPSVSVFNPGPGGGTSNAQTFTVRTNEPARATLFYPRLSRIRRNPTGPDTSENTGIAVANLSGADVTLTISAFDNQGSTIAGADNTNPQSVTVAIGEQLAILASQLFGPDVETSGWIKIESTAENVVGFFLTFNDSLTFLDGADASSTTLMSFLLPEIEPQGYTQIHVVNPSNDQAAITFQLFMPDGTLRAAVMQNVSANGTLAVSSTNLFGITPDGSDYVRATSNRGVVAFEYLGVTGQYSQGLNGQDATAGATVIYSPQYVVGGDYRTTLSVVNLDSAAGMVTFEFIRDDGVLLGVRALPVPARGKIYVTDQRFFLDSGNIQTQGYVKITSNRPLAGSVVFSDPGRTKFSSALPLVSTLQRSVVFSQLASDQLYFTGIAIVNPGDSVVNATIDVRDENGNLVAMKVETIPAKQRRSLLLTQYFPQLVGQNRSRGYIRVTADNDAASFALYGTHDGSVLAAIPPQVAP